MFGVLVGDEWGGVPSGLSRRHGVGGGSNRSQMGEG